MSRVRTIAAAWLAGLLLTFAEPAQAAVVIRVYSHDFDQQFPHAFVVLKGQLDATGEVIDTDLGYSALQTSPAILIKSVTGRFDENVIPDDYIARSQEHFSLVLSDEEYRAVMAVAAAWKAKPQPSYNLNSSNCVHFVSEVLLALHLKAEPRKGLMRSPRSFLTQVTADSAPLIAAHVYRPPQAPGPVLAETGAEPAAAEPVPAN